MSPINDKPVLAFDCATPSASVAFMLGGKTASREVAFGKQAALLVPTIDALLREHGVGYADLGCIVSTIGPGSFTGLRIALAALHGLVLAHGTPLKITTASHAVAWDIDAEVFHVALNAGKGEVFVQSFAGTVATGEIALLKPEAIADLPNCYGNILPTDHPHYRSGPQAATLCRMAHTLPLSTLAEAMPLYIRPPDAKIGALPPWLQPLPEPAVP